MIKGFCREPKCELQFLSLVSFGLVRFFGHRGSLTKPHELCKERWQLNEGRHLLSSPYYIYRSLFLKGVMLEGQEKCIFIISCHTIQSTLFGHCCSRSVAPKEESRTFKNCVTLSKKIKL